jgi:hypothetical protein
MTLAARILTHTLVGVAVLGMTACSGIALSTGSDGTAHGAPIAAAGTAMPAATASMPQPTRTPGHTSTTRPTTSPTSTATSPTNAGRLSTSPASSAPPAQSSSPATATQCGAAANTPGGSDPWGGCWPGSDNTGPTGSLTAYTGKVNPDGSCLITSNTAIIGKTISCQVIVNSGNLTLEDSSLTGEVYNYGNGSVLIEDSTLNGGDAETETVLGSNITIERTNLYGNQHEIYCSDNCTIENSWLHDNHDFGSTDHQNGFLTTGGSEYDLQHNSVGCTGGCTGDITFLGSDSHAVVNKNLLVAAPGAAYCLYPYSGSKPGAVVNQMTITDNVFQRGAQSKCAYYGPVYGWDNPNSKPGTSGYDNVWSGNVWDNGKVLPAP